MAREEDQQVSGRSVFDLPVHPAAAALGPMRSDEELNKLAADIKAHGLRVPLVVKDGYLIDGRNRREACRRAGVYPQVEELIGVDSVVYILSSKIAKLFPDGLPISQAGTEESWNASLGLALSMASLHALAMRSPASEQSETTP